MYRLDLTFRSPFILVDNIKISSAVLATSKLIGEFDRVYSLIKTGKLRFSSLFPRNFLPKPNIEIKDSDLLEKINKQRKLYKKIKFVSIDTINKLKKNQDEYINDLFSSVDKEKNIYKNDIIFRNNLQNEKTELFSYNIEYLNSHNFSEMSLYFEGDKQIVMKIMKILSKIGISSKRSIGMGKFTYLEPKETDSPFKKLLLSKSKISENDINGNYKIKEVNLISRNDNKLAKIFVFEEGSWIENKINGGYFEFDNYLTSLYPIFY